MALHKSAEVTSAQRVAGVLLSLKFQFTAWSHLSGEP